MNLDKLKELLENTKVEDCAPKSQNIIVLESTETVPNALKVILFFYQFTLKEIN